MDKNNNKKRKNLIQELWNMGAGFEKRHGRITLYRCTGTSDTAGTEHDLYRD